MIETFAQSAKMNSNWDKRVQRAAELAGRFAFAKEILDFYGRVLTVQQSIFEGISSPSVATKAGEPSFRSRLGAVDACAHLPALLSLAEQYGPAKLAEKARTMRGMSDEQQPRMLQNFLGAEAAPNAFFARALLQPYAERLAADSASSPLTGDRFVCPVCGSHPQAAVLRPEGDGGKRFLLCSLCLTEWEFRRILCAACGEENHKKLPRYSADDVAAVRVEACDTCHLYLKSIDMTVDGLAVPLVDEVATVPLDLWAAEHGYKKIEPNLMGF
jgi:FdhE protein